MIKSLLSKIVNIIANVFALTAMLSMIILAINNIFVITTNEQFINIMLLISKYAGIVLIILVSVKCALKLPFFIRIPYYILIAIFIIIVFFEPVFQSIIDTFFGNSSNALIYF